MKDVKQKIKAFRKRQESKMKNAHFFKEWVLMSNGKGRGYVQRIVTGLLAFAILIALYPGAVDVASASSCSKSLTAHNGNIFVPESNYLESPIEYHGAPYDYTIINMRTYKGYGYDQMHFWNNYNGHARFGVSREWILNVNNWFWYNDPWLLVYKC